MQTIELAQYPDIARVIRAADSSYKKKKAFLSIATSVELNGTAWDSGSRSTYTAVNLATLQSAGAPQYPPPMFGGPRTPPVAPVPDGIAVVETGIFCGKTATAHVTVNPANAPKFLPDTGDRERLTREAHAANPLLCRPDCGCQPQNA